MKFEESNKIGADAKAASSWSKTCGNSFRRF
jgi:hypothetical protein